MSTKEDDLVYLAKAFKETPYIAIFSTILVLTGFVFLLHFFGVLSLEKAFFWKNTNSRAQSAVKELTNITPIEFNQADVYRKLHPTKKTVEAIEARDKTKKRLISKTIEVDLRIVGIEKYGSRYQVVTKNESPKNNAEMLGADVGRSVANLFGKQSESGHTVSFCGTANIYSTSKEQIKVLNNLSKGNIIRVRGSVSGFSVTGEKGLLYAYGTVANLFASSKDDQALCINLDKAVLLTVGGGTKSWLQELQESVQEGVKQSNTSNLAEKIIGKWSGLGGEESCAKPFVINKSSIAYPGDSTLTNVDIEQEKDSVFLIEKSSRSRDGIHLSNITNETMSARFIQSGDTFALNKCK